jgi:hypothetical protein
VFQSNFLKYCLVLIIEILIFNFSPLVFARTNPSKLFYKIEHDPKHEIIGHYPIIGQPVSWMKYYEFHYDNENRIRKVKCFKNGKSVNDDKLGSAIIKIRYEGCIKYYEHLDTSEVAIQDNGGVYSEKIETDSLGKFRKVTNLDKSGLTTDDNNGIAYTIDELDNDGNPISCYRYNISGQVVFNKKGEFISKYYYYKNRYPTEKRNYNKKGNLLEDKDGIAIYKGDRDSLGNIIMAKGFGIDGQLRNLQNNYAVIKIEYDDYGNERELNYFSISGNITQKIICDSLGQGIELRKFDTLGNLLQDTIPIYRYKRDSKGNAIEISAFDHLNQPRIMNKDGAVIFKSSFDAYNREISRVFCDSFGKWIDMRIYDTLGNMIEIDYYGGGQILRPCPKWYGVAKIIKRYNKENLVEETSFYDSLGSLINASDMGIAIIRINYNEKGLVKEKFFLDANKNPKNIKGEPGYASEIFNYNSDDQVIGIIYYDQNGKIIGEKR